MKDSEDKWNKKHSQLHCFLSRLMAITEKGENVPFPKFSLWFEQDADNENAQVLFLSMLFDLVIYSFLLIMFIF